MSEYCSCPLCWPYGLPIDCVQTCEAPRAQVPHKNPRRIWLYQRTVARVPLWSEHKVQPQPQKAQVGTRAKTDIAVSRTAAEPPALSDADDTQKQPEVVHSDTGSDSELDSDAAAQGPEPGANLMNGSLDALAGKYEQQLGTAEGTLERAELQKRDAVLAECRHALEQARAELAECRSSVEAFDGVRAQLQKRDAELAECRHELEQAGAKLTECRRSVEAFDGVRAQLQKRDAELAECRRSVEAFDGVRAKLLQRDAEIAECRGEFEQARAEYNKLRINHDNKKYEMHDASEEIAQLRERLNVCEARAGAAESKLQERDAQCSQLQERLRELADDDNEKAGNFKADFAANIVADLEERDHKNAAELEAECRQNASVHNDETTKLNYHNQQQQEYIRQIEEDLRNMTNEKSNAQALTDQIASEVKQLKLKILRDEDSIEKLRKIAHGLRHLKEDFEKELLSTDSDGLPLKLEGDTVNRTSMFAIYLQAKNLCSIL